MLILSLSLEKVRLKIYCICLFIVCRFIFLQTDRWISLMFQVQTRHEGLSSIWKTTFIQRNKTDRWGAIKSRFICQNQGLKPTVEKKYHFTILEEFKIFFFVTGCLKMWNFPAEKLGRKNGRLRYTCAIFLYWFCK